MSNVISIQGYDLHLIDDKPMVKDLDLAERLGFSRDRDIRKIIKRLIDSGSIMVNEVCDTVAQTPSGGRPSKVYFLGEKAVLKVITKSETEKADQITDEMIDVFIDYRNGNLKPQQDLSRMDILQMAIESEKEKLVLKLEVEELKPKAEFCDKVAISEDAISIGQAAKIIGTGRNRLLSFLRNRKWVTRINEPYQAKIESGLMDVKIGQWEHPKQGLQRSVTALLTGKGLVELQHIYGEVA